MANSNIAAQMEKLLDDMSIDIRESSEKAIKEISKEAVEKLRSTSPKKVKGINAGRYARGWKVKIDGLGAVIYNATDPGFTHLLEKGHAIANGKGDTGGRTSPQPHIQPVEEWIENELPERILRGIE